MIGALLDAVRRRAGFADTLLETDETVTATVTDHEAIVRQAGRRLHLRVEQEGRVGLSTREDLDLDSLVEGALGHARYGAPSALLPPSPAPLPAVLACYPAAAALGPEGWHMSGLTDNYLRVFAVTPRDMWNELTPVKLEEVTDQGYKGRMGE